ncbi:uncharacterized protein K441DRAFT_697791 [Cenococcum geophilum 1.58]|uniref:uncharacterized protein n=1 Tax=Cenococcum geophilum 1.58 TaxID=794803 RepID=UPI00358E901B|nr:hypothetical protein K441DRAFT_697791 [Cenococcum geophilum 1.58]
MAGAGRDHIVSVPPFYLFILIAQIVLAIIVLGLAAYSATFHIWFGGNGYAFFCSIASFIINGYYIASTLALPAIYNCWVFLILECLHVVWWLACWADLAAWASAYSSAYDITTLSLPKACYFDADFEMVCEDAKKHKNAIAAAAGIGALLWLLAIVSLAIFAINVHRHRTSGSPYTVGAALRSTSQNPQSDVGKEGAGAQQTPQSYPMNQLSEVSRDQV